jgi:hypothetical protein
VLDGSTHCSVGFQLRYQVLCVLQNAVGRSTSKKRGDLGVIPEGQDARGFQCFRKHLFMLEPEDFGFLCCPSGKGIPIQSMDSNDTEARRQQKPEIFLLGGLLDRRLMC